MEVHHPHHPTHKKKWSEYIIEFVMLFTAVTLGFFAENIRESIAEKHKKDELLEAVVRDFKIDKAEIQLHRKMVQRRIDECGRFTKYLQMDYKKVNKIEFYRSAMWYLENKGMILNEKARNDAEGKGYFTNFKNGELANILNKYNYHFNDYKEMNLGVLESSKKYTTVTINDVLDYKLIQKADFAWNPNGKTDDKDFQGNLSAPVNIEVVKKIVFDAWMKRILLQGELAAFDSMDLYANRAIAQLHAENK